MSSDYIKKQIAKWVPGRSFYVRPGFFNMLIDYQEDPKTQFLVHAFIASGFNMQDIIVPGIGMKILPVDYVFVSSEGTETKEFVRQVGIVCPILIGL